MSTSLRKYRDEAGLSQAELEALSGVTQATISRIEAEVIRQPKWHDTLVPLARALSKRLGRKVAPDALIPREGR